MANFNDYYEHINIKNVDALLAQIDNISKINDRINECCNNLIFESCSSTILLMYFCSIKLLEIYFRIATKASIIAILT